MSEECKTHEFEQRLIESEYHKDCVTGYVFRRMKQYNVCENCGFITS